MDILELPIGVVSILESSLSRVSVKFYLPVQWQIVEKNMLEKFSSAGFVPRPVHAERAMHTERLEMIPSWSSSVA